MSRLAHAVARFLPTGNSLPLENWARRHRHISALLSLHVFGIPLFGVLRGEELGHVLTEGAIIGVFAVAANVGRFDRKVRAAAATFGLIASSAILTHLSGGMIEMHFHFFVMVVIVSLYQSWEPFLLALALVILHHGLAGAGDLPMVVFNHPAALANPWKWALVHGVFVLAESLACLVAWRLHEDAFEGERTARALLHKTNRELVEAQGIANVGSWEWDISTGSVGWSSQLHHIFGVDQHVAPTLALFADLLHPDDRPWVESQIAACAATGQPLEYDARIVRADDGEVRWISAHGRAQSHDDGNGVTGFAGTVQDITERKESQADLERLALTDTLTGLANRDHFYALLQAALDHVEAPRGVGLLLLDLDGFKEVNDGIGHHAGDLVLREVARRINATVRGGDKVARLGGDEFTVLLPSTKGVEDAIAVARNIRSCLEAPFDLDGIEVRVNASIGVVTSTRHGTDIDTLLKKADVAMYRAKTKGSGWGVFEAAEGPVTVFV